MTTMAIGDGKQDAEAYWFRYSHLSLDAVKASLRA